MVNRPTRDFGFHLINHAVSDINWEQIVRQGIMTDWE